MSITEFYERKDINEFLREHPLVGDLYDAVLQNYNRLEVRENPLTIFNRAYRLCMQIVDEKMCFEELRRVWIRGLSSSRRNSFALSLMVAWSLLSVHGDLLECDKKILRDLYRMIPEDIDKSPFKRMIINYINTLEEPVNFSGRMVVTAAAKAQGGESPQEKMQKAGVMVKEAFDAVTDENKQMAKRIAELEAQVMQYKVQITSLMSQLERQKEPKVIEVEKYPEDAIYKAISHRTITDYACGLSSKYPAPPPLVISTMLSKLAVRGLLPNEDMQVINEDIIKIDNSMDKETATIINNHFAADSKCQNFNGDVKDSKFMTYDGKEGNQ